MYTCTDETIVKSPRNMPIPGTGVQMVTREARDVSHANQHLLRSVCQTLSNFNSRDLWSLWYIPLLANVYPTIFNLDMPH